jgi:hypothetical protein
MAVPRAPDLPYQTAYVLSNRYKICASRLQTMALKGLIRVETQESEWAPILYCVEDVARFIESRKLKKKTAGPRREELATSPGN